MSSRREVRNNRYLKGLLLAGWELAECYGILTRLRLGVGRWYWCPKCHYNFFKEFNGRTPEYEELMKGPICQRQESN